MSRARQARRIAKQWAITLGFESGREDVDGYAADLYSRTFDGEVLIVEEVNDALLATLRPSHGAWSEGAMNAQAHKIDGADERYAAEYYRAYDEGAKRRISELVGV